MKSLPQQHDIKVGINSSFLDFGSDALLFLHVLFPHVDSKTRIVRRRWDWVLLLCQCSWLSLACVCVQCISDCYIQTVIVFEKNDCLVSDCSFFTLFVCIYSLCFLQNSSCESEWESHFLNLRWWCFSVTLLFKEKVKEGKWSRKIVVAAEKITGFARRPKWRRWRRRPLSFVLRSMILFFFIRFILCLLGSLSLSLSHATAYAVTVVEWLPPLVITTKTRIEREDEKEKSSFPLVFLSETFSLPVIG